jgi:glycosyltransferase involved in cell wall biosynthesis
MKRNLFHIFAYGAHGEGISGGDRIFIELARRLVKAYKVRVYVSDEGERMCRRGKLHSKDLHYQTTKLSNYRKLGFVFFYFRLIVESIITGFSLNLANDGKGVHIYSASEFWMDSLACFILKLRYKKVVWIASWYQTAPSPLRGFSVNGGARHRIAAFPYWFTQLVSKPYVSRFADVIVVNNLGEKSKFPLHDNKDRLFVMYGAVDLRRIKNYKLRIKNKKTKKKYTAVFQGRFHPQKGVVELIDIWKKVVEKKPDAKLAMIGDGPLMRNVKLQIAKRKLGKNIKLFGYVFDGAKKYKIFKQSRVVVHPAYFDSGGMASAEAMAFGLPVVGFDLPAYKDYYASGMVKVPVDDKNAFANMIIKLIKNEKYYNKISKEALRTISTRWSWDKRVEDFKSFILAKQ